MPQVVHQGNLFWLVFGSIFNMAIIVYLFFHYLWVFLFQRISPKEGRPEHLIEREDAATLFKYRALLMALSMIPAMFIGAQLLKVLHLVY